jgi:hypothetical protein
MGKRTKGALFSGGPFVQGEAREVFRGEKRTESDPDGMLIDVSGWPVRYLETLKKRHRSADEMCAGHYGANHGSQA